MDSNNKHAADAAEADNRTASASPANRLIQAAKTIVEFETDATSRRVPVVKSSLAELLQAGGCASEEAAVLRFRSSTESDEAGARIFPLKPPSKARSENRKVKKHR